MAEENQHLVQNEMPAEDVITVGNQEPRRMTCSRSGVLPALSVFVALLLAGQAVSVYFITQQQGKIGELTEAVKQMKLQDMIKKLPGSPPSQNRPKPRLVPFNIPLAFSDDNGSQQKLEQKARASNSVEDAALYMLQMNNPLRKYPSFNGTILDNFRKLRRTLGYDEWMLFDSWMQQWYLLNLVQNSEMPDETTPSPDEETATGVPLMTPCQLSAQARVMPGAFKPQCDENGAYVSPQCWMSTNYCWCVDKNGTEIPGTRTRGVLDCSKIRGLDTEFPLDEGAAERVKVQAIELWGKQ